MQGDASCPELKQHVHCRNCPVYSAGAMQLLDREMAADALSRADQPFAQPKRVTELPTQSIVIFRIGPEWLALPTAVRHGGREHPPDPYAAAPAEWRGAGPGERARGIAGFACPWGTCSGWNRWPDPMRQRAGGHTRVCC